MHLLIMFETEPIVLLTIFGCCWILPYTIIYLISNSTLILTVGVLPNKMSEQDDVEQVSQS